MDCLTLSFADGEYRFRLAGRRIDEVEAKCQAGLGEIYSRVMAGLYKDDEHYIIDPFSMRWKWSELREVFRQALIGGGGGEVDGDSVVMTDSMANRLMTNYMDERPQSEILKFCAAILHAAFDGYESPKKEEPVTTGVQ